MVPKEKIRSGELIYRKKFETEVEAIDQMESFGYGRIRKVNFGNFDLDEIHDPKQNIYFRSVVSDFIYQYTIENHRHFFMLRVYRTHRHMMITGAKTGDLNMLKVHFEDTEKMREFSLTSAIENGHWNIVDYLVNNYSLETNPVNYAIRWKQLQIVENLININNTLPKNWLSYGVYYDSFAVTETLLVSRRFDFSPREGEGFFLTALQRDTNTARMVKEFLLSMDFQSNETTQVNLKNWIEHKKMSSPVLVNSWRTND